MIPHAAEGPIAQVLDPGQSATAGTREARAHHGRNDHRSNASDLRTAGLSIALAGSGGSGVMTAGKLLLAAAAKAAPTA